MAYAPAGSRDFFTGNLPASIGLLETAEPNFGACLFGAADSLLAAGHGAACLLNSDSPTLPTGHLVAAATVLAAPGDRIVVGPATDGGYYLIGLKQPHRRLFQDVDWSTERVFRQKLVEDRPFRAVGSRPTPATFTRRALLRLLETTGLAAGSDEEPRSSLVA
jgi:hypothetical protein